MTDSKRPDMTLEELERRIRLSWGPDTCQFLHLWDPDRPEQGQCGTTAMVVMDIMGGELLEAEVHLDGEQIEYHYWTRLPNGREVDFTRTQFDAPGDRRVIGEPVVKERPPTLKPEFQSLYDTMMARVRSSDDEVDTGS